MRVVLFALVLSFFAGCMNQDSGIYYSYNEGYVVSSVPKSITRSFKLPEKRETVADCGRAALVGRWRHYEDMQSESATTVNGEIYLAKNCSWRLFETVYHADGTYSQWNLSKDFKVLPHTERGGAWEYEDGVLKIRMTYQSKQDVFGRVTKETLREEVSTVVTSFMLSWHDQDSFTAKRSLRTLDANKAEPGTALQNLLINVGLAESYTDEDCILMTLKNPTSICRSLEGPRRFTRQK